MCICHGSTRPNSTCRPVDTPVPGTPFLSLGYLRYPQYSARSGAPNSTCSTDHHCNQSTSPGDIYIPIIPGQPSCDSCHGRCCVTVAD